MNTILTAVRVLAGILFLLGGIAMGLAIIGSPHPLTQLLWTRGMWAVLGGLFLAAGWAVGRAILARRRARAMADYQWSGEELAAAQQDAEPYVINRINPRAVAIDSPTLPDAIAYTFMAREQGDTEAPPNDPELVAGDRPRLYGPGGLIDRTMAQQLARRQINAAQAEIDRWHRRVDEYAAKVQAYSDLLIGTGRMTEPDGTVTEAHVPVVDNGEVHTLNVADTEQLTRGITITMDDTRVPSEEQQAKDREIVRKAGDDFLGQFAFDVEHGGISPAAAEDLRNHGIAFHRVSTGEDGAVSTQHVPIADICQPDTTTRAARAEAVRRAQHENRARYWTERGENLDPDIVRLGAGELGERLLLGDGADANKGRRGQMDALLRHMATFTPLSLPPPTSDSGQAALLAMADTRMEAYRVLQAAAAIAEKAIVENEELRGRLVAGLGMMQAARHAASSSEIDPDVEERIVARFDTLTEADARQVCIDRGWLERLASGNYVWRHD